MIIVVAFLAGLIIGAVGGVAGLIVFLIKADNDMQARTRTIS